MDSEARSAAIKRRWTTRRRRKPLDGVHAVPRAVIEFVPGDENGRQAYFWIGDDNSAYATIDARTLARWVEGLRDD